MIIKKNKIKNKSFTLVEIMVTITIFSLIFGVVSSMFASAIKAQRKSLFSQELLSQTSYIMEYMGRYLRMARKDTNPSCLSVAGNYEVINGGNGIRFLSYEEPPRCWEFYLNGGRLMRKISGTEEYLTSDKFEVEKFAINLIEGDQKQPRITLSLKMKGTGGRPEEQPVIEIQTTISQRNLNVE